MQIIPFEEFMARTLGGRPNQMNVAPYIGHHFNCACGASHLFDPYAAEVLRELPKMRLVLACPQREAVTCVKVKGVFRFRGFESLFGAHPDQESNAEPATGPESPNSFSDDLEHFVHERISYADRLACNLWQELGVKPAIQARHGVGTVAAAMATFTKDSIDPDAPIDAASRFLNDSNFEAFLHEPDVRRGLRQLARDTRAAARSSDGRTLAELLHTFLLMPSGGPSSLSPAQWEAVVECAASISADTMAQSLFAP